MGEALPESVISDLRAAGVEPVRGLVFTDGETSWRLLAWNGGWEAIPADSDDGFAVIDIGKPWKWDLFADPRDRLTFLGLCDVAERRGVERLPLTDGSDCYYVLSGLRSWAVWADDDPASPPSRMVAIAALARALRESAPKEAE